MDETQQAVSINCTTFVALHLHYQCFADIPKYCNTGNVGTKCQYCENCVFLVVWVFSYKHGDSRMILHRWQHWNSALDWWQTLTFAAVRLQALIKEVSSPQTGCITITLRSYFHLFLTLVHIEQLRRVTYMLQYFLDTRQCTFNIGQSPLCCTHTYVQ